MRTDFSVVRRRIRSAFARNFQIYSVSSRRILRYILRRAPIYSARRARARARARKPSVFRHALSLGGLSLGPNTRWLAEGGAGGGANVSSTALEVGGLADGRARRVKHDALAAGCDARGDRLLLVERADVEVQRVELRRRFIHSKSRAALCRILEREPNCGRPPLITARRLLRRPHGPMPLLARAVCQLSTL